MSSDIISYTGLGFSLEQMKPDEDYTCDFHNLNEDETQPIECPERPILAYYGDSDSVCMCEKHFQCFTSELIHALLTMANEMDVDVPEDIPEIVLNKNGDLLTKSGFTEMFCVAKKSRGLN